MFRQPLASEIPLLEHLLELGGGGEKASELRISVDSNAGTVSVEIRSPDQPSAPTRALPTTTDVFVDSQGLRVHASLYADANGKLCRASLYRTDNREPISWPVTPARRQGLSALVPSAPTFLTPALWPGTAVQVILLVPWVAGLLVPMRESTSVVYRSYPAMAIICVGIGEGLVRHGRMGLGLAVSILAIPACIASVALLTWFS